MKKFTFKQYFTFFIIYFIGMFLFYKFYLKVELIENLIITTVTGILATLLSVWIASKRKSKD